MTTTDNLELHDSYSLVNNGLFWDCTRSWRIPASDGVTATLHPQVPRRGDTVPGLRTTRCRLLRVRYKRPGEYIVTAEYRNHRRDDDPHEIGDIVRMVTHHACDVAPDRFRIVDEQRIPSLRSASAQAFCDDLLLVSVHRHRQFSPRICSRHY